MKVKESETGHEIPMFSGYKKRKIKVGAAILLSVPFLFKLSGMEGSSVIIGWLISYMILHWCLNHFIKRCMWELKDDCIKRIMPWNVREISYEEIREALQTKNVKITMHAFQVPKRRGWIPFYYEVGNKSDQRKIKKSYEFLAAKVSAGMPKMTQRLIGQIDRSFLYRKDRRNGSIFMLNRLFKGIYFGKKTEQKIQEIVESYPNTRLRRVIVSYEQMVLTVLLAAALNLFWLFI
ncbi:hypothetical protein FMM74_005310 [Lachnospiraceae bacterium MD308]|nr:hypothetical protein [Lachnospiraceae bacterium MD308]